MLLSVKILTSITLLESRGCDFSDCVFWRHCLFLKTIDVSDCVKNLVTTFSAFQKSKNLPLVLVLSIYHVVMWETKGLFFYFVSEKADEVVKRNQKRHFFEKQIKSSKNATWKGFSDYRPDNSDEQCRIAI